IRTPHLVRVSMPKITSILEESMTIKPVRNSTPFMTILTLVHIEHVCILLPGEVTTIVVLKTLHEVLLLLAVIRNISRGVESKLQKAITILRDRHSPLK